MAALLPSRPIRTPPVGRRDHGVDRGGEHSDGQVVQASRVYHRRSRVPAGVVFVAIVLTATWMHNARALPDASSPDRAEFQRRRSHLPLDHSQPWISLGAWAREHGLLDEADALFREYLQSMRWDNQVYESLVRLAAVRPLPAVSAPSRAANELLPARFARRESTHFVVFSDADSTWTHTQTTYLERAYHQFQRFTRLLDLDPLPLRHKLVCILFQSRADYRRFAEDHDGLRDAAVAGYYSPNHDRIVFYHPSSNPSVGEAQLRLTDMERDIDRLKNDARGAMTRGDRRGAASLRRTIVLYRDHLERERAKVGTFLDQTSVATTVHEAIHQLLFHRYVQTPSVQYPLWVSEGLATAFETDRPLHAFGPDHHYDVRREAFDALLHDGKLLAVRDLVQLSTLPSRRETLAHVVYHQSGALVSWMCRFRRRELTAYLELMRREPSGRPSPSRHLELFESAFGDPARLERAWLHFEHDRAPAARDRAR